MKHFNVFHLINLIFGVVYIHYVMFDCFYKLIIFLVLKGPESHDKFKTALNVYFMSSRVWINTDFKSAFHSIFNLGILHSVCEKLFEYSHQFTPT